MIFLFLTKRKYRYRFNQRRGIGLVEAFQEFERLGILVEYWTASIRVVLNRASQIMMYHSSPFYGFILRAANIFRMQYSRFYFEHEMSLEFQTVRKFFHFSMYICLLRHISISPSANNLHILLKLQNKVLLSYIVQ